VLDALAIAGQVLVGRALGGGDAPGARVTGRRLIELSFLVGLVMTVALLALRDVLPRAFTSDPQVLDELALMWPLLAGMLPFAAIVFALDGILIGAGDTRYLAAAMALAAAAALAVDAATLAFDWGIVGVWAGLAVLMAVRLATTGGRFAGSRWAVTGGRREALAEA
jgi:Na+-driven multidrug efflux pump